MIFCFAEDALLSVFADADAARRQCEGIDVESGVFVFYAEDGTWLRPRFTRPNRTGGWWIFRWVESGHFELDPEPAPPPDIDPFDVALAEAVDVQPNDWFPTLAAVRGHVEALRAGR